MKHGLRFAAALLALAWVLSLSHAQDAAQSPELCQILNALEPTPMGDSYVGETTPDAFAQLRFPVPKPLPVIYALQLGNIVALSGRGTSYQLVLRRDRSDGPVVYEGPVIAGGDQWNADNLRPIDIVGKLTDADAARGYIDIFASAIVKDDGWAVYRHNPGRPITALAGTQEMRRAAEQAQAIAKRGIAVVPVPQKMVLADGEMKLTSRSRILLPKGASDAVRFAAGDLAEQITERCGLKLRVAPYASPTAADIALGYDPSTQGGTDGYRLVVDGKSARALGGGETGLFYAVQTLAQLVGDKAAIPHVTVDDWPDYPLRGLQYDVARGQTVKVDWWKRVIRCLARYKLNAIMIYGEDDYRFKAYPFLGRPDTFTPEKAAELSAYARQYHLQLIPQYESLGHAGAVLGHDEMKDLRENGDAWVFCTCNPKTWEFLDTAIGELCDQFPDCKYIHVGADEFEFGFGKCPSCAAKVKAGGYVALYAEHMNHLNQIIRKRGRTMLFWPSHGGPSEDLSFLSIKAAPTMERDCIPTEWIYHGPAAYPEIEQYQKLGYKDVWASAAVVCFSVIWPDYATTYRGIRGFLRAGAGRKIGGAMTTTWEWMYGGIVANSLMGMTYAAECAWSLGKTPVDDFERRYGASWLGLRGDDLGKLVHSVLADPWPATGLASVTRDGWTMRGLVWEDLGSLRQKYALRQPALHDGAGEIVKAADDALARLDAVRKSARRNGDLLSYAECAFRMYRLAGEKLVAMEKASVLYAEATKQFAAAGPAAAAGQIEQAAAAIESLSPDIESCLAALKRGADDLGAWVGDVDSMTRQRDSAVKLAGELRDLAAACRRGETKELPPGRSFGLISGRLVRLGEWQPATVTEAGVEIKLDVTGKITHAGDVVVELDYVRGAHGLRIDRVALLADGKEVAADEHGGWAGAGSNGNVYTLKLPTFSPQARYEIVAKVRSSGGTDSFGEIWLVLPD
jgi:hypothetical protein